MSIAGALASGTRAIVSHLLPQDCGLCGAPSGDSPLCTECLAGLPRLPAEGCPQCALPVIGGAICGACLARTPKFDATRAAFRYGFPVDRLVQSFKYGHRLAAAEWFAAELAAAGPTQSDLVIAVPLSTDRLAQRGFNQALELARPLARRLGLPLLVDGVARARDTAPQAALPWKDRVRNVRHAFDCTVDLAGHCVMVVDDVMTTGATLDELARTLKAHGAIHVENRVIARALRDQAA